MKENLSLVFVAGLIFLGSVLLVKPVQAGASATVSWTAPTTDKGGGTLTGLTGYKVYYSTSSRWLGMVGTCLLGLGNSVDVEPNGSSMSYFFNNILNPGSTYYFTVVALDGDNNISDCATGAGEVTEVNKRVTYTADINNYQTSNQKVDIYDFNLFFQNFGSTTPGNVADMNKDGVVNIFDYNFIFQDFGRSFI